MTRTVKHILGSSLLAAAFFLMQGCLMYSDKDENPDPSGEVVRIVYGDWIQHVFPLAELAEFMTDDSPGKRTQDYFGDVPVLYQDTVLNVISWGKISLAPDQAGNYLVYDLYDREYSVSETGPHTYMISGEMAGEPDEYSYYGTYKNYMTDAVVRVGREELSLTELTFKFIDSDGTLVSVSGTAEPAVLRRPASYYMYIYPHSGRLDFELSGTVSDKFTAVFTPDGVEIER